MKAIALGGEITWAQYSESLEENITVWYVDMKAIALGGEITWGA